MNEAIGEVLPLGLAVALSPLPIIAVVLMLATPRAKVNGISFVLGSAVGVVVVGAIVLAVANGSGVGGEEGPSTAAAWAQVVLGALMLLLGLKAFAGRPRAGETAPTPKWMEGIDHFTAGRSFAMGALLSGVNPKNLALIVAASASIAASGVDVGEQAVAFAVFAVLALLGTGTSVAIYLFMGERAEGVLAAIKAWMIAHNTAIMVVMCVLIGAKVLGAGVAGLG